MSNDKKLLTSKFMPMSNGRTSSEMLVSNTVKSGISPAKVKPKAQTVKIVATQTVINNMTQRVKEKMTQKVNQMTHSKTVDTKNDKNMTHGVIGSILTSNNDIKDYYKNITKTTEIRNIHLCPPLIITVA